MSPRHHIDLLIPGLLGPVPVHPDDLPETPVLVRILGRADRRPNIGNDPVSVLLGLFGIETTLGQDLPSAPFCCLADLPEVDSEGYVLHADPIHLRPDRDGLLLFDAHHLDLGCEESDALVDLFNRHFMQDGLRLEAMAPERWYLHVEHPPSLLTTPLYTAVGRSISDLLPTGQDAAAWSRLLNEAQMLFHHAQVNQIRERGGRPTVSGIWPWGGGRLSTCKPTSGYTSVFAANALARGLASATDTPSSPIPDDSGVLIESAGSGSVLVFRDGMLRPVLDADGVAWTREIQRLEAWIESLVNDRKRLGDVRIRIFPCNGECFEINVRSLRRFWRKPFALGECLGRMNSA